MADFATAVLSAGNLVFDRSQKTSGWIYAGPSSGVCGQDTYVDPSKSSSRPSCEFLGSDGVLEAYMMLYDAGNVTYSRTNALQVATTGSATRVAGVVGSPVAIRGPASASSYPITYRVTSVSVTSGNAFYLYHWRSRSCGPTANAKMVSFTSVGQAIDIVLNCPAQALYFDTGSGVTSFDIQLTSINSFAPMNFTITPGATMNYTTRAQDVFEIKLLFTSSAFSLIISGNSSWTSEGTAAIFSGSCSTTYNTFSRGSVISPTEYKVNTYSLDVSTRPDVMEATLQIRTRVNVPLNLQISVIYNGDSICSADAGLIPTDCAGIVDYPTFLSADFYVPSTASTNVQGAKDFMTSVYPTDAQQNTPFYREVIRQSCLRAVPKCTAGGVDTSVAACRRDCYAAIAAVAPAGAAELICQSIDTTCPVYNFTRIADPIAPPMASPVNPPVAPPVQPPVEPTPVAQSPVSEPVGQNVPSGAAPTASQAPVSQSAPQSSNAAPKASSAPGSTNQASSAVSVATSPFVLLALVAAAIFAL
jgi:hypothetical protein